MSYKLTAFFVRCKLGDGVQALLDATFTCKNLSPPKQGTNKTESQQTPCKKKHETRMTKQDANESNTIPHKQHRMSLGCLAALLITIVAGVMF